MEKSIDELVSLIRSHSGNLFIVHGNVYDTIRCFGKEFRDAADFLASITEKKFPQLLIYDLFSGVTVVRGDEKKLQDAQGEKTNQNQSRNQQDSNADLARALKEAKKKLSSNSAFPLEPEEVFPIFDIILAKTDVPTVIIIEYADTILPASFQKLNQQAQQALNIAVIKWSRSRLIKEKGHLIFLVLRQAADLDEKIIDRSFESIQIRLRKPEEKERKSFFIEKGIHETHAETLGKITAGLSFKDIAEISLSTDVEIQLNEIFTVKQKILREEYSDILEIMNPRLGFEALGGLEKQIAKLKQIAGYMRTGKTALVPMGILFNGPPGTGKTLIAEAFAKEAGLNFIKPLDIKSMWLGESERRMTRFLNALRDLAPVVPFIDELSLIHI